MELPSDDDGIIDLAGECLLNIKEVDMVTLAPVISDEENWT